MGDRITLDRGAVACASMCSMVSDGLMIGCLQQGVKGGVGGMLFGDGGGGGGGG